MNPARQRALLELRGFGAGEMSGFAALAPVGRADLQTRAMPATKEKGSQRDRQAATGCGPHRGQNKNEISVSGGF